MPNTTISDSRGLVQRSGSGLNLENAANVTGAGIESVKYSASTSTGTATGNVDVSVEVPVGALITDIGFICTEAINCAGASTLTLTVGTSAGAADVLASKQVNATGTDVLAGAIASAALGNSLTVGGDPFAAILPAQLLYNAAVAETLHMRLAIAGAVLDGAGAFRMYVKYIVIN